MWHIWVERASEAKGTKHATDSEKDIQARQTRNDQENMLLPISRKRTFQESMAALESEEDRDTEIEGEEQVLDSGNETTVTITGSRLGQLKPTKQSRKAAEKEEKIEKKRKLKERVTALDEKFVDQGDRLINVVEVMAGKMGTGTSGLENKRFEKLEAEVSKVKEVGEAMAEKVSTMEDKMGSSAVRLDQIFEMLQEMRNRT